MRTSKADYLRIGQIIRPHGIKGALKLLPLTSDNKRFNALCDAFLEVKGKYSPIKVTASKCEGDFAYISIEGVTERNAAELLRGVYICVDREHAVKLKPGEYFIVDLIGCNVFDSENNLQGRLSEVYETGANDVYEVDCGKGRTLMFPALKRLLMEIDIEKKRIVVDTVVLKEVGLFSDSVDE